MTSLSELRYWHITRRLQRIPGWVAHRLPLALRRAVLVDCAVRATTPPRIGPDDYAGPDGVTFHRMYDALEEDA